MAYLDITQVREIVPVIMNWKRIAEICSDTVCTMKSLRLYALKKRQPILDHVVWK